MRPLDAEPARRTPGGVGGRGQQLARDGPLGFKKNSIKPWLKECWCIPPKENEDFAFAMEDVIKVYQRDFDDGTVLVCMDESSRQLTRETRAPLPTSPGQPAI